MILIPVAKEFTQACVISKPSRLKEPHCRVNTIQGYCSYFRHHSTKKRGSHVCSSQLLNVAVPTLLNTGSKAFNIMKHQLFASSLKDCSPLCIFICTSGNTTGVLGDLSKPPGMMFPQLEQLWAWIGAPDCKWLNPNWLSR